jgi:transcriptional regulator with PAS, ATPase and Fis domain/Tfp pilus assembly protein PilF
MDKSPQRVSQEIASKIKLIESLIEQKKFKEALAEIRDLESQKITDQFSIERGHIHYLLSLTFHYLGRYEEGLAEGRKAFDVFKNTSENEKIAQIQFTLGNLYVALGNFEKAELELRDAVTTYRRIENKQGTIKVYNKLANICFINCDFDKAIKYVNQCIGYCDESGDKTTKAKLAANLSRIYILIGRWQSARESLLSAVKVFEEKNDELYLCQALLSLGYVSYLQRDFKKANKYYEQALKIIFENNYTREFAIYHEYSGELEFVKGNYEKAKNHYLDAIGIGETIAPDSGIISQTYRLLAELQVAEKRYDEALSSCEKALKVATSLDEKIEIGAIHRALGQIYTGKREKEKAKENFEKSISILEQIGAKFELGKTYLEIVKSNAFEYFDRVAYFANAREVFKELQSDYYVGKVTLAFCEMLLDNGEYEKVEVYLKDVEKAFKRANENEALDSVLELRSKIDKALGKVGSPQTLHRTEYHFSHIVTQDPQMSALIDEAKRFKDADVSILLEGETGTGKDLLAKAIHCESKRKNKRFVKVNCAAIPESLLESELFGHRKGAFTGADRDKNGLFEEADGGTIFLNEIGDLPMRLQAKILDVTEDKEVTRIGEVKPRKTDFRVITSTNKNLTEEVAKGDFRKDLYHRLNVVKLELPPLRKRKQDIPLLIKHFLANSNIQIDPQDLDFQPYLEYHWPGNVRELENEFRKCTSVSELIEGLNRRNKTNISTIPGKLMEMEKSEILEAIKTTQDKKEAAKLLGISLATLYRKIKFYDVNV